MRPLLFLVAASMVSLLGTGCNGILGCEGGAPIVDTTPVVLHAPVSSARTLPACEGVPELTGGYAMAITANAATTTDAATTDTAPLLRVSVAKSVVLGQAMPLTVSGADDERGFQTGDSADRTVHLAYVDPSDGSGLEETPVAAALVTVNELPAEDGDLLQLTIELHYEDGRILSQTFSAADEGMDKCFAY